MALGNRLAATRTPVVHAGNSSRFVKSAGVFCQRRFDVAVPEYLGHCQIVLRMMFEPIVGNDVTEKVRSCGSPSMHRDELTYAMGTFVVMQQPHEKALLGGTRPSHWCLKVGFELILGSIP